MADVNDGRSRDQGENRVLQVVGKNEKGLVLLRYLDKKDEKDIRKMKERLAEVDMHNSGIQRRSYDKRAISGCIPKVETC